MANINQVGRVHLMDIPCYNGSGSDIAAGLAVALDSAKKETAQQAMGIKLTTGSADFFGITAEAIKNGKTGRVSVYGVALGTAGAAITFGAIVMSNNAGKIVDQTAGLTACGKALCDATADGDPVKVLLFLAKNA